MAALLVILVVLWRQRMRGPFSGHTFALFVALYAGSRLFLETFRADAPLVAGSIRLVQPIALVILLGAVWYLYRRHFSTITDTRTA
jgi:prolipoprotein diacylglyceryltransferase